MPKPTKLHAKERPMTIQKPPNAKGDKKVLAGELDHETAVRQFELELCWCIQKLEKNVSQKNGSESEKSLQDAWKVLTILKNNNQPIIRKRQVMRSYFGDYRAAMALEEKKLPKMISKMKIKDKPTPPKATFIRKSAFMATGNDSFKFNFDLAPEQVDKSDATRTANITIAKTSDSAKPASSSGDSKVLKKYSNTNESKFYFTGQNFMFNFDIPSKNNE